MSKNLWWCDCWVVITLKFFFSHSLQCLHTFIVHVLFKIIGQCNIIFLLVLKTTTHLSTYSSRLAQAWYRPQSKLWYKNQEFPKVLTDRTTLIFYPRKFTELKFNVIPSASTEGWNGNIHLKHELWNCNRSHFVVFHVVSLKQVPNLWILSRVHCLQNIVFPFIIFFLDKKTIIYQVSCYRGCWRTQISILHVISLTNQLPRGLKEESLFSLQPIIMS